MTVFVLSSVTVCVFVFESVIVKVEPSVPCTANDFVDVRLVDAVFDTLGLAVKSLVTVVLRVRSGESVGVRGTVIVFVRDTDSVWSSLGDSVPVSVAVKSLVTVVLRVRSGESVGVVETVTVCVLDASAVGSLVRVRVLLRQMGYLVKPTPQVLQAAPPNEYEQVHVHAVLPTFDVTDAAWLVQCAAVVHWVHAGNVMWPTPQALQVGPANLRKQEHSHAVLPAFGVAVP